MDVERLLICKILDDEDLVPVLDQKITPSFFEDDEHRNVFAWVLEYWNRYGQVPTARVLKKNHPTYRVVDTPEPYAYYIDEMRSRRKTGLLVDMLSEVRESIEEEDSDSAIKILSTSLSTIQSEVSILRDTNLIETWEKRYEAYMTLKDLPNHLRGVPTGFQTIDYATSGLQPQQLITLVGPPKAGKSTMMMKMALAVHNYGKTPLFIGFEMSNEEQEARHDAMIAHINHHHLITGRLTAAEEQKLRKAMRAKRNMHPFILSADITSTSTVSGIAAKIEQVKPDVVFIDGVYMMEDENGEDPGTSRALTNITRSLKRLAQRTELPIVDSTQVLEWKYTKKKGIESNSIGYTSSFAQDSDVVIGVEGTDSEDLVRLSIVLARNAAKKAIMVKWDWDASEFEELEEDIGDEDDEDDDSPTAL